MNNSELDYAKPNLKIHLNRNYTNHLIILQVHYVINEIASHQNGFQTAIYTIIEASSYLDSRFDRNPQCRRPTYN